MIGYILSRVPDGWIVIWMERDLTLADVNSPQAQAQARGFGADPATNRLANLDDPADRAILENHHRVTLMRLNAAMEEQFGPGWDRPKS